MRGKDPEQPINPDMVRLARESKMITQSDLASLLGMTQGKVSKVEAGLLDISALELAKLATVLDRPEHFFRWTDRIYGFEAHEIFHRKRQVTVRLLTAIHADMNIRRMQMERLLRSVEIAGEGFPQLDPDEYGGDIERMAQIVRNAWRLPPGPVANVTEAIENAGGIVVPYDFGTQKVDAMSHWVPGLPPLFYVNTQFPADRTRWSGAHEIGHMVMHRTVSPRAEDEANRFAAEFLMPAAEVRHDLHDLTLGKLAALKQYWKVSMQAVLHRARDLGVISPRQARRFWMEIGRRGYRRQEPFPLAPEQPSLYLDIFTMHRTKLNYSLSDLADLLAENHIQSLWTRPAGKLSIVS